MLGPLEPMATEWKDLAHRIRKVGNLLRRSGALKALTTNFYRDPDLRCLEPIQEVTRPRSHGYNQFAQPRTSWNREQNGKGRGSLNWKNQHNGLGSGSSRNHHNDSKPTQRQATTHSAPEQSQLNSTQAPTGAKLRPGIQTQFRDIGTDMTQ